MYYEIQIKLLEFSDIFVLSSIETCGIMSCLEENRYALIWGLYAVRITETYSHIF
jgi:hypothetical protein